MILRAETLENGRAVPCRFRKLRFQKHGIRGEVGAPETGAPETGAGFVAVADLDKLRARRVMIVKHGKKQIALFASGPEVYACNNRCPHEGYPLSEGTLSAGSQGRGCLLTCNWHNWKFDLESGETLVGSDNLRRYPVRLEDGKVWLDLADPPPEARAEAALEGSTRGLRAPRSVPGV